MSKCGKENFIIGLGKKAVNYLKKKAKNEKFKRIYL